MQELYKIFRDDNKYVGHIGSEELYEDTKFNYDTHKEEVFTYHMNNKDILKNMNELEAKVKNSFIQNHKIFVGPIYDFDPKTNDSTDVRMCFLVRK